MQGATWCSPKWSDADFDEYVAARGATFSSVSLHRYATSVCHGDTTSIEELMADKATTGLAASLAHGVATAAKAGAPLYVGEGNSCSCGGKAGVSDVWAAAVWALDALFSVAAVGVDRWAFHGMPRGPYSTFSWADTTNDAVEVRPLFYGLLGFATAARAGSVLLAVDTVHSSNAFVKAWSVVDAAGTTRVILIHKDPAQGLSNCSITVAPVAPLKGAARLTRGLPGPAGLRSSSSDAISFGGLSWATTTNGEPSGAPTDEAVPAGSGGDFTFALPPASFAILSLPPA